ncbi:MAG TPA: 16S rRNA (uracil(1498)-N(3))-methyltransferase [Lachnospiraceae bacterium]|nr:16S rRNA (uracil(1498)-N(3))-methyltransferase [Lachnospiraceae bacterium]
MFRFFINSEQIEDKLLTVEGSDVNHIRNVLRMKAGEDIEAVDENGRVSTCRIREIQADRILADLLFSEENAAELSNRITLYMGLPKFDKMELVIQKAVELGAYRIVPVSMKRCVVKLDPRKAENRVKRWQSIAESAAKQAKRGLIPEVSSVISFRDAVKEAGECDHILFPYECAEDISKTRDFLREIKAQESVAVFIGPEGGFDPSEVEAAGDAGAHIITLGRRILRTETAAITAMSILMFALEK